MKHISTIVNTILAILMILIVLATGLPNFSAHAAGPTPQIVEESATACSADRIVQVNGTAVVNVQPDRALIQLGVQSNGRTPKEVQSRNAATVSQVIQNLQRLGVEARDIATDRYVIEPLYEDYDALRIKGYRIHNVLSVTMRDVDQTSDAIATAFEAGANQVVNVEFYSSELRKYRDQAREMAMQAAFEKASALAQAAGAETDCVTNISENSSSYFHGWSWWYGGGNQNLWTQNAVQNVTPATSEPASGEGEPVSMGLISIRAEVSATYGLK